MKTNHELALERCKKEVEEKAKKNHHDLGEWKLDKMGYWRAYCQNRNCCASVWIKEQPWITSGGIAISDEYECCIKSYKNRLKK